MIGESLDVVREGEESGAIRAAQQLRQLSRLLQHQTESVQAWKTQLSLSWKRSSLPQEDPEGGGGRSDTSIESETSMFRVLVLPSLTEALVVVCRVLQPAKRLLDASGDGVRGLEVPGSLDVGDGLLQHSREVLAAHQILQLLRDAAGKQSLASSNPAPGVPDPCIAT